MQYRIRNGDQLIATVTNTKQFRWEGLQPNTTFHLSVCAYNGLRESQRVTVTTKTRGIRINIPTWLKQWTTYTLTYEEYPLGVGANIGQEPAGFFGGGNRQDVPATVISSGNTSILEITNSFNLIRDNLIMRQLPDGSFAVFDNYKALYFKR